MNPLSLVPTSWLWPAAAIAGAALFAALGVQTIRVDHALRDLAEIKAAWQTDRAAAAEASRKAEAAARAEETRVRAEQEEKIDAAEKAAERARADRAIADAAAGRLSQRVAALVAAAREAASHPQVVQPGAPTADPAGMLADVLGRCVARVRLLATVADERGTAGQLCEQSYDAMTAADPMEAAPVSFPP